MTQQINLLNVAFRKGRLLISARHVAVVLVLALAAMAATHLYFRHRAVSLGIQLASAQRELSAQRTRAARLAKPVGAATARELEAEVAALQAELKAQRENLAALKGGVIGSRQGFSAYLRAFSREAIDGLWLTSFTIGGQGDITLKGRVTQPELLADYLRGLNKEPVLRGRSFAALEIERPRRRDEGDEGGGEDRRSAGAAAYRRIATAAPAYLDFTLATKEPAPARAAPAAPARAAAPPVPAGVAALAKGGHAR